jgi:hypothetical protein
MSNTVISKLWGVCHTRSCDDSRVLEITWGFKMSKLLNLIAYSLACLLAGTNWVLSCICERLAKHASWISVALFEMILVSLYMSVLVEVGDFMLVVNLLNFLFTSFHNLAHGYLLVISLWSLCVDSVLFASLGIILEYSYLNTCLYTLWSTLIFISCIASNSSLQLCLMSSLPNRERLCTKLVELLLIGW